MVQIKLITATWHKKLEDKVNRFLLEHEQDSIYDVTVEQCHTDLDNTYYLAKVMYDN